MTLSACECTTALALRATCCELAASTLDGQGRLLAASAVLPAGAELRRLRRLSPQLLTRLHLPSVAGEDVFLAIAALLPEMASLREVMVRLATPRLRRAHGEDRQVHAKATSKLAKAFASSLPCGLKVLEADLRGGCFPAAESAIEEFSAGIPQGLTRLCLELSYFNTRSAQAVASALPKSLKELRLLFHGRAFVWLGMSLGCEDTGLEDLAAALPRDLRKLHLMLECTDQGAAVLCRSLPEDLVELDLDLHFRGRPRVAPELLPEALANMLLSSNLVALRLRLLECTLTVEGLKAIARAMPRRLKDLRLDLCGPDIGDEGARILAPAVPKGLTRLALCLRSWRFTEQGAKVLGRSMPKHLRRLKVVISGSPIGASGARALVSQLPPRLEQLNLSLRLCSIGSEGERLLQPLARRWNLLPRSWIRVRDRTSPLFQSLEGSAEWDLWDD